MNRPQDSCWKLPKLPETANLEPKKPKNDPKIQSKLKGKIKGNPVDKICSAV